MDESYRRAAVWIPAGGALLGALLMGLMLRFGARSAVLELLAWLNGLGVWGPVVFVLIQVVVVLCLVPGVLFTMGAGFLFGPFWGSIYILTANLIGASLAFMAARTLFRRRIARFVDKRPRLRALDRNLAEHGWKTIMLTRCIPFFPFKLSNYGFGVMHFSLRDFIIGSAIGMIPITVMNVVAGSLAADLATMESVSEGGAMRWWMYGLGLAALLLLVIYLGRMARKQLHQEPD